MTFPQGYYTGSFPKKAWLSPLFTLFSLEKHLRYRFLTAILREIIGHSRPFLVPEELEESCPVIWKRRHLEERRRGLPRRISSSPIISVIVIASVKNTSFKTSTGFKGELPLPLFWHALTHLVIQLPRNKSCGVHLVGHIFFSSLSFVSEENCQENAGCKIYAAHEHLVNVIARFPNISGTNPERAEPDMNKTIFRIISRLVVAFRVKIYYQQEGRAPGLLRRQWNPSACLSQNIWALCSTSPSKDGRRITRAAF